MIEIDLTDNVDIVECGFNESEACTSASTIAGIFNALDTRCRATRARSAASG